MAGKGLNSMVALAAALALGLSGFSVAAHADDSVVKIGLIGSLTGPYSTLDTPPMEGVRMAVRQINDAGGVSVKGKKYTFELVEEDSQSKPEVGASSAQKLLSDSDIRIVMGILESIVGMASAPRFSKAKVLYIGGFTMMDGLVGKPGNELMFRALDTDAITAQSFVPTVTKELNLTKIGMLLQNDDVGKSIVKLYQAQFEKLGANVELVEYFQPDTTDFAPVLRKFQRLGLDGMFIGYADPVVDAIVRQSIEIGGIPTRFVYRGGSGAAGVKYADRIEGYAWQILTRDLDHTTDPKVLKWIAEYKDFTKNEVTSTTFWGLTFYDSVFMLARAMEAAGTVSDPGAIAAKLKGMRYDGVRQMYYDAEGHARTSIDIGIVKAGKVYSVSVVPQ